MDSIDLRSDTLTKPTLAMRKAMADAPVGDDVYGEDPTVNLLQERVARILGKEQALFISSGSMGNLITLYLQAGRGGEVLAHEDSHIIHYEVASGAALAGCQILAVPGARGILRPENLESRVRTPLYYNARTKLVEIENTGNLAGGTCYSSGELQAVYSWAQSKGLPVHMDGARLWNACAAQNVEPGVLAQYADTVTVCFSKGLGAPVGSVLAGTKHFIDEARRVRKMLGGGLRQAGVLAAAAIYALDHHRPDLEIDHQHAKDLAETLKTLPWAAIPQAPETNILFVDTPGYSASAVANDLASKGILVSPMGSERLRFVTHRDLTKLQILEAKKILETFKPSQTEKRL